ncbi:MAG: PD40 domain-containing protein [Acidobacteria bacterium]|nr:PD40 domain-containing protein [Acidobacteriota bacterium]
MDSSRTSKPAGRLLVALAILVTGIALSSPAAEGRPTKLVSLGSLGNAGNMQSGGWERAPAISANGRYVAFFSSATDLVPRDTNDLPDVFVRDQWGATTTRVSLASPDQVDDGSLDQADGSSSSPAISADGRSVAFDSTADNLVAGDGNQVSDVFVRDVLGQATERISVTSTGAEGESASTWPSISADGSRVAFASAAALVQGDANGLNDIYVRDRSAGTTVLVSSATSGGGANGNSFAPAISPDGRFVAYHSDATNLVAGDTNTASDAFVRDLTQGTTTRVSVSASGEQANGPSQYPSVSAGGSVIAFESQATNLVAGDMNNAFDVFARSGGSTARISVTASGLGAAGPSAFAAVSADGTSIAFASLSADLIPGDANSAWDVFVRAPSGLERVSVSSADDEGNGDSFAPVISGDGITVSFASNATNLVSQGTLGVTQVYAHIMAYACASGEPESGTLSGPINEQVEPAAGPAEALVNRLNCEVVVPHDL